MNEAVVKALIAAGSAILGAIVAAAAKGYAAKQKLQEIKLSYEQRLHEGYLEKAREYTQGVYVPLSIALTQLNFDFQILLSQKTKNGSIPSNSLQNFQKSSNQFQETIKDLAERGANAFLTTELDEKLQSFCSFLNSSSSTTESVVQQKFEFILPFIGSSYHSEISRELKGKWARLLRSKKVSYSLNLIDIGFSYEAEEILAAPLGTGDFEMRFTRDVRLLNILIKEVTLGAKAKQ